MTSDHIDSICDILKDNGIKPKTLRAYDIDTEEWMKYSKVHNFPTPNRHARIPSIVNSQGEIIIYNSNTTETNLSFIDSQPSRTTNTQNEHSDDNILHSSVPTSDMILSSESVIIPIGNKTEKPEKGSTIRFMNSSPQLKLSSEPFEYLESEKFEDLLNDSKLQE